jgi:hypothetical protein
MQPIDYITQVRDPVQMALAGYTQGQGILANRQQMAQQQQQMEMQRTLFDQQQQAMQAQQQRGQEMQGALMSIYDRLSDGTLSPEDVFQFQMAFPEAAEEFRAAYEGYTKAQMEGEMAEQSSLIAAVASNPAVARRMLERRMEAAEASGDEENRIGAQIQILQLDENPMALLTGLILPFANIPGIDQKVVENVIEVAMPSRNAASVEGKIFQDYQGGWFGDPNSPRAQQVLEDALEKARGAQVAIDMRGGGPQVGAIPPETVLQVDPTNPSGYRLMNIPGGTRDIEAGARERSQETMDTVFSTMAANYLELDRTGNIRNPARGTRRNIEAWLKTSVPGQELGRAIGSEAQSLRDQVTALQPNIVQAILAQPGVTARSIDTPAELAFFMKSVSNPEADLFTNMVALHTLDMKFGSRRLMSDLLNNDLINQQTYNRITRSPLVAAKSQEIDSGLGRMLIGYRPIPVPGAQGAQGAQGQGAPTRITNDAAGRALYESLPSRAKVIGPDGQPYEKP